MEYALKVLDYSHQRLVEEIEEAKAEITRLETSLTFTRSRLAEMQGQIIQILAARAAIR